MKARVLIPTVAEVSGYWVAVTAATGRGAVGGTAHYRPATDSEINGDGPLWAEVPGIGMVRVAPGGSDAN
jgi:hypothetical protein